MMILRVCISRISVQKPMINEIGFRIDNGTEGGGHYLPCCIEHTHTALCWSGFGCGLSNLICRRKLSCKYDIRKAFPLKKENLY